MGTQKTVEARPPASFLSDFRAALEYDAPFLLEKLIKDKIVDSADEGNELFNEVKKYLALSCIDSNISWEMYSTRVDEVWHQFVLFTHEYADFCEKHLGGFVHHRPSNAPGSASNRPPLPSTFPSFAARYQEIFGQDLPECWVNEKNITLTRRLINDRAHRLVVSESRGIVSLEDDGFIRFSANSIAREALMFIAATGVFYVRELPGQLTDEERVALASVLVEHRLLRIAP